MVDSARQYDMTPSEAPDADDQLIDELVAEALKDFEGVVPPQVMQAIRDNIADTLAATDAGQQLVRQMRPDPVVNRSAEVGTYPVLASDQDSSTGTEGGGKRK